MGSGTTLDRMAETENKMANVPTTISERPTWLETRQSPSWTARSRASRHLSRLLMTYIITGLVFMLLPGTFLGVWNLTTISSRSCGIHFSRMDTGPEVKLFRPNRLKARPMRAARIRKPLSKPPNRVPNFVCANFVCRG